MKKLAITISAIFMLAMISLVTSANANNTTPTKAESQMANQPEEEALHCKVEDEDGNEVSCWFCNCRELADQVLD